MLISFRYGDLSIHSVDMDGRPGAECGDVIHGYEIAMQEYHVLQAECVLVLGRHVLDHLLVLELPVVGAAAFCSAIMPGRVQSAPEPE